jgi:adenylate kinase
MAYYKQTSPLIGYYYAKEQLSSVNGLGEIDGVAGEINAILD